MKNINFDNNQKFVYLDEQYRKDSFFEILLRCLQESSKSYYYFLKAIIFHHGFISVKQLPAYSCSPIEPLKGHKLAQEIIKGLHLSGLLSRYDEGLWHLDPDLKIATNISRYKAIEIAKKTVMNDFVDWARKINLISYNRGKFLSEAPEFFKMQWGFTAPSYIQGIRKEKLTPGFIVADVLLGEAPEETDIEFFLKKIAIIRQCKNAPPFVPVLIADCFKESAFKKLKKEGVFLGFVNTLFGSEYANMLKSLVNIIENASNIITQHPDRYFELIDSIAKMGGKASNLKGDVFELAVGYYYSQHARSIEVNKNIIEHENGKAKEIDVFVDYSPTEIRIVECKGYNYPLEEEFVDKWLHDNIPAIRDWILSQDDYARKSITFELWSTGGFSEAALHKLKDASERTRKYKIRFLGKEDILRKSQEDGNKNLQRIIKVYFSDEFGL